MQLRSSPLSPYVRKVCVVAHELDIWHRIKLVPTALRTDDAAFYDANPLAKIPVLTTDDGAAYFDSAVICEYLDATFGARRLLPADGPGRWAALTAVALADGIVDAGILVRGEMARPIEARSADNIALQMGKVSRGLDRLQQQLANAAAFDLPGIAAGCAIGWLRYRFGEDAILGSRKDLKQWYDRVASRPSMQKTVPAENA
jgi:glutathione S-transferase